MKLPRKLKKRIIKVFGRGTYYGLRDGHLKLRNYYKQVGVITHNVNYNHSYYAGQHNPYLRFQNIN